MITAATLREYRSKELAQMAKEKGVPGWHGMKKEQLVRALVRVAKREAPKSRKSRPVSRKATKTQKSTATPSRSRKSTTVVSNGRKPTSAAAKTRNSAAKSKKRTAARKGNPPTKLPRDLSTGTAGGNKNDRAVLLVRDAYWLHVNWEISRQSILRAKKAMAQQWHVASPIIRLLEVDAGNTTSSAERIVRDIPIHGGVQNWYIDITESPKSYQVLIGYLAPDGEFFVVSRTNAVNTPSPGSSDSIDQHWSDIADDYEKVYAQSGGYDSDSSTEMQKLFEERLRRPMGSPSVIRFGVGSDGVLKRDHDFAFEVNAEMIVYGSTKPDARVTLGGKPVKLRPDGTFTVRMSLPDRRQVLPVVASSSDGVEQRTTVLAIERNTKVMEPKIRDPNEVR